jgi:hypothetical protein
LAKTFSYELVWNQKKVGEAQIKRKAKGVTESAPSKWCWFDYIVQILASTAKADNLGEGWGREWGYQQEICIKIEKKITITPN